MALSAGVSGSGAKHRHRCRLARRGAEHAVKIPGRRISATGRSSPGRTGSRERHRTSCPVHRPTLPDAFQASLAASVPLSRRQVDGARAWPDAGETESCEDFPPGRQCWPLARTMRAGRLALCFEVLMLDQFGASLIETARSSPTSSRARYATASSNPIVSSGARRSVQARCAAARWS